MKKLVSLLLACILVVTLVACNNKDVSKLPEGQEGNQIEGVLLETEEATLKYVGVEKAKKKLCDDYKTVYLLKFEYSNKTSEPKQCQTIFQIKAYQEGVQISEPSSSYSSEGGAQYELLGNYFKETLDGGTVTFAKRYSVEKVADVKVIMEDDNNNKATFVIKAEEFQPKTVSVSADVIKENLQGTWDLDGQTMTFSGDTINVGGKIQGVFVVNIEESTIDAKLAATDGTVNIQVPFEYENDTLKIFNNQNQELIKK